MHAAPTPHTHTEVICLKSKDNVWYPGCLFKKEADYHIPFTTIFFINWLELLIAYFSTACSAVSRGVTVSLGVISIGLQPHFHAHLTLSM